MMNLQTLKTLLGANGCKIIYVKKLAPNDNSKNQVYLGGSFDILNIFPTADIVSVPKGIWKKDRFKAALNFSWIDNDGNLSPAPDAQFILYPKYPEVRFSGFLNKCSNAPSELMTSRDPDRLLFMAAASDGRVLGHVVAGDSQLSLEFLNLQNLNTQGVFTIVEIVSQQDNRNQLIAEMIRIHQSGWINSKKLTATGAIVPCNFSHCGGYTLEAELGIRPNSYSEPDYLGWEIKQYNVGDFERIRNGIITLMTPEPTHGYYVESGVEAFIRKYGYPDKRGRPDRINFGGIHKIGEEHSTTHLRMKLIGFNDENNKITRSDGRISLLDGRDNEAASWSFSSLLKHWNRKHNLACYIPSQKTIRPNLRYWYGNNILLGSGTDFTLFLQQMSLGNIYYDPGIKLEHATTTPTTKRRSQFRINSRHLQGLYYSNEIVNILNA
jgi:hypothetical protein